MSRGPGRQWGTADKDVDIFKPSLAGSVSYSQWEWQLSKSYSTCILMALKTWLLARFMEGFFSGEKCFILGKSEKETMGIPSVECLKRSTYFCRPKVGFCLAFHKELFSEEITYFGLYMFPFLCLRSCILELLGNRVHIPFLSLDLAWASIISLNPALPNRFLK